MQNIYQLEQAKVVKVIPENPTVSTFYLKKDKQSDFRFLAGQFMQIGLPGFGECPISISSNPKEAGKYFALTIRAAGALTNKLQQMKVGDVVYGRGPFGNGFPEVNKNLILIGGGCGFIPLLSVYEENKTRKDIKIQLFFGCVTKADLVFARHFGSIQKRHDLNLILEQELYPGFSRAVGQITKLLRRQTLLPQALIFVCGPEKMYKFVVKELLAQKVEPAAIYLSLERRMHCGVGICQHCAIGTKYVCRDGPIFDYPFLEQNQYFI